MERRGLWDFISSRATALQGHLQLLTHLCSVPPLLKQEWSLEMIEGLRLSYLSSLHLGASFRKRGQEFLLSSLLFYYNMNITGKIFPNMCLCVCWVSSVVSNSETPWTIVHKAPLSMGVSPGKNTGEGCHALLQGIFLTQGSNLCLLHLQRW